MAKKKGYSAWLVTKEGTKISSNAAENIVEILSPRIHAKRIREIVELLYHRDDLLAEKIEWRLRRKSHQPYPAEFQTVDGVPWEGEVICGHNPWLRARLVSNLVVGVGLDGKETATWEERHTVREMSERVRRFKQNEST